MSISGDRTLRLTMMEKAAEADRLRPKREAMQAKKAKEAASRAKKEAEAVAKEEGAAGSRGI